MSSFQLERPDIHPPFLVDGDTPHLPLYVNSLFPNDELTGLSQSILCLRVRV